MRYRRFSHRCSYNRIPVATLLCFIIFKSRKGEKKWIRLRRGSSSLKQVALRHSTTSSVFCRLPALRAQYSMKYFSAVNWKLRNVCGELHAHRNEVTPGVRLWVGILTNMAEVNAEASLLSRKRAGRDWVWMLGLTIWCSMPLLSCKKDQKTKHFLMVPCEPCEYNANATAPAVLWCLWAVRGSWSSLCSQQQQRC